jgi:hypothetical protein
VDRICIVLGTGEKHVQTTWQIWVLGHVGGGGGGVVGILFKIRFSQIEFSWISIAQVRIHCWAL